MNSSLFRTLLLRGDIPCQRAFCRQTQNKSGTYLMWKIPPQDLDYCYYLPVFFDGYVTDNFLSAAPDNIQFPHIPINFNFSLSDYVNQSSLTMFLPVTAYTIC